MSSQVHTPGPGLSSCPPSAPSLLLPAFPGAALLVTSADAPGSKLIIKLKREGPMVGGAEEMPRTQTFFLTGMPLGWAAQRRDGLPGPGVRTVLLTKAGEDPGGRKSRVPETVPSARAPPPSDSSFACTSKGVYENYRRWQRYKALARRHFPATPDAEALACFFIPVLRSLARLRPDMTLEDGVPRAVQEWEHSSNFERMIFYEMAENRQPRRRQRRPPSNSAPGAPREIPAEAVHQYAEIMEGLDTSWEEDEDEKKEQGASRDPQGQEDGVFLDSALTQYIDQLCDDEEFVTKVEAVIHPQFMARLLSPEKSQDPMDLVEELEEELNLTPNQLTEKRLLALTEEEREPSMYPTSHSDSTPSQSEEEDEVSCNGKGEDASCRAMKRPSGNEGIRITQTEFPAPTVISPLAPHSHRLGNRDFLPKGIRAAARSSLNKYGSHESQEGNLLPSLKATDEGETHHLLGQDQVRDHSIRISPQVQRVKPEVTPNVTENSSFTGKQGSNKTEEGIPRACTTQYSKQNGSQENKAKGQMEVPKMTEHSSQVVTVQFHNGGHLVWNNIESANNKYAKHYGTQQGDVRCLKKTQAFWEIKDNASKEMDHDNQDMTKILFGDHIAGGNALKLTLNRQKEMNVDHAEKVIGQSQIQNKEELGYKNREMKPHWDNHMKQSSQEHIHHACEKQDGCQGEIMKDQCLLQVIWKGPKSTPAIAATHSGIIDTCCQGLTKQDNVTLPSAGSETELDSPKAKVQSQKKPEVGWKQANSMNMKDNSPAQNSKLSADKLPLQNQSASIKQSVQQSNDSPILETDQEINFKSHAELTRGNGQLLTSADSGGIGSLEDQISGTDSEHLPCFNFLMLKSPSLRTQKGPERGHKSQWPLTEQCKITSLVENFSDEKQVTKPTLNPSNPNPLSFVISDEAEEDSCGPGGDHAPISISPGKVVPTFPPQLILQDSSSNNNEPTQRYESNASSKSSSLESNTKNLNKVEEGGLLERVMLANIRLPELQGSRTEDALKYGTKREEEYEDEELSNFSSLLASKLSLSTPSGHGPLPMEQGDTLPSSPTDTGKQDTKTRHSTRGQMSHNSTTLTSKNMEANPAVHRSHKRKSNSSGTRRSKRLRNQ
ncbi:hypothetical protein JD844_001177 [Phrynosoma platyrhinos]|uniref:Nuclear Testis protein N-terminal domain-containing protein n=1 Tax=Phrynosoma platyrhinos TaxID=52577 RepID=A0ABQ7TAP1_PHRPL|nr:hypothetical protein JD844_001177 [Phrynosoma platyrhinos]